MCSLPLLALSRYHYNTKRPHSSLGYRPPAPEVSHRLLCRWTHFTRARPAVRAFIIVLRYTESKRVMVAREDIFARNILTPIGLATAKTNGGGTVAGPRESEAIGIFTKGK